MNTRRLFTVLALWLVAVVTVQAAHITDKLVVGLYPEPKAEGTPLQLLPSGTPLEVLQRKDGFAEVRLADDKTGWVESGYVTKEKPAKAMLLETQAKLRQMGMELAALREQGGDPDAAPPRPPSQPPSSREAELQRALSKAEARVSEVEALLVDQQQVSDARQQLIALNAQVREALGLLADSQGMSLQAAGPEPAQDFFNRYQTWIIGLSALLLGFAVGIAFIDRRIRKRYGGFRI